ncbi:MULTISPECIES: hypothetical protein [unclassified Sphingomonas]|jgi:hypothetical protein|nr:MULTISPECIES: hypothetical protein [unclassified Sphingomonas]
MMSGHNPIPPVRDKLDFAAGCMIGLGFATVLWLVIAIAIVWCIA